jgi:Ca2+-binding RTX toxin-like protein
MSAPGILVIGDGVDLYLDGSAGDDSFDGSNVNEVFYPGLGNDVLYAGGGEDQIVADLGNDWLDGGSGIDVLYFTYVNYGGANGELSSIGVTFDLSKHVQDLGYWGVKTTYNFENVYGSAQADSLYGDGGDNELNGYRGDDRLDGRSGIDNLYGEDGSDVLIGGSGNDGLQGGLDGDRLTGGAGADILAGAFSDALTSDDVRDTYIYTSVSESGLGTTTRDTIWGAFAGTGSDRIDLSRIDANGSASGNGTFSFIGEASFHTSSTGEVQVRATGNANEYLVKIDTDTDSGSEMTLLVHSASVLTASDFIL